MANPIMVMGTCALRGTLTQPATNADCSFHSIAADPSSTNDSDFLKGDKPYVNAASNVCTVITGYFLGGDKDAAVKYAHNSQFSSCRGTTALFTDKSTTNVDLEFVDCWENSANTESAKLLASSSTPSKAACPIVNRVITQDLDSQSHKPGDNSPEILAYTEFATLIADDTNIKGKQLRSNKPARVILPMILFTFISITRMDFQLIYDACVRRPLEYANQAVCLGRHAFRYIELRNSLRPMGGSQHTLCQVPGQVLSSPALGLDGSHMRELLSFTAADDISSFLAKRCKSGRVLVFELGEGHYGHVCFAGQQQVALFRRFSDDANDDEANAADRFGLLSLKKVMLESNASTIWCGLTGVSAPGQECDCSNESDLNVKYVWCLNPLDYLGEIPFACVKPFLISETQHLVLLGIREVIIGLQNCHSRSLLPYIVSPWRVEGGTPCQQKQDLGPGRFIYESGGKVTFVSFGLPLLIYKNVIHELSSFFDSGHRNGYIRFRVASVGNTISTILKPEVVTRRHQIDPSKPRLQRNVKQHMIHRVKKYATATYACNGIQLRQHVDMCLVPEKELTDKEHNSFTATSECVLVQKLQRLRAI
ncbi:hypothetical protein CLF_109225 [Clonorchis sinensis]|uniref:Uncharacterized protein n=1 Tax=Clonorchis sinensis TaxID=79923 RepID=G7YJ30_CLOSI|nr:hypothetical protein CLF_109225 [Clonorchis sinensis]